jgi:alkanesulfonate monooxygenase SsuD/methylene tetrahydromethanopterin reductase-like flavin-dependent oxidoreductase (luciferase family)
MPDTPTAPGTAPAPPLLGLAGWLGQMANLTATGLICLMFYQGQQVQWQQAREDRVMYTQQLEQLRADANRGRETLDSLTRSVESLADEVRELRRLKP